MYKGDILLLSENGDQISASMSIGNYSIPKKFFKDNQVLINQISCTICHKVPWKIPLISDCQKVYCEECSLQWSQYSNFCFESCQGKCQILKLKQIDGILLNLWSSLKPTCSSCYRDFNIQAFYGHHLHCSYKKSARKQKSVVDKIVNNLQDHNINRLLKEEFSEIRSALKDYCENQEIDESLASLLVSLSYFKEKGDTQTVEQLESIIRSLCHGKEKIGKKLSVSQMAALRKGANLSVRQAHRIKQILEHIDQTTGSNYNCFLDYSTYHKDELNQFPNTAEFSYFDKTTLEFVWKKEPTQDPNPSSLLEDYVYDTKEDIKPNMIGFYFQPDSVLAKVRVQF